MSVKTTETTAPRRLCLREWSPAVGLLSPEEATALVRAASRLLSVELDSSGATRLIPGSYVGRARVAGFDLWLEPKVPVSTLLALLSEASDLVDFRDAVDLGAADHLEEFVARAFLREVDTILRQGLHRLYERHEEPLASVRGRVDVRKTAALFTRATPRVHCEFDEFTHDTPENRLVLAALRALSGCEAVSQPWRVRARNLRQEFLGVSDAPVDLALSRWNAKDPRTRHYRAVLGLAGLVLRATGFHERHGEARTSGFLVDMNQLFETILTRRLTAALVPAGLHVRKQAHATLDVGGQVPIRPDLVVRTPTGRVVVVDAKYKATQKPSREDLYQMVAYCRALGARDAILVGAQARPESTLHLRDGTRVHLAHMALETSEALFHSVKRLGDRISQVLA